MTERWIMTLRLISINIPHDITTPRFGINMHERFEGGTATSPVRFWERHQDRRGAERSCI